MRIAPRLVLLAPLALAGCSGALPVRRDQLMTVERAVQACSDASGALTPQLRAHDHSGAENAAIAARNACSVARAQIVAAIGRGTRLDICAAAVDAQETAQSAELANLDMPSLANGRRVADLLDVAIRQQTTCAAAIEAAARGG